MGLPILNRMPRNLSKVLFGSWLVGMGLVDWAKPGGAGLQTFLLVVLGLVLIGAGVCTLLGR